MHLEKFPNITKQQIWEGLSKSSEALPKLVQGMFRINFEKPWEARAYKVGSSEYAALSWSQSKLGNDEFKKETARRLTEFQETVKIPMQRQSERVVQELAAVGVNAQVFERTYLQNRNKPGFLSSQGRDYLVLLPLDGNFDAAATFLAYLIHTGRVTEKDIELEHTVYPVQEVRNPFDRQMYKLASGVEYQNKVRAGLGEPLLEAVTSDTPRAHGILHTEHVTASRTSRYRDLDIGRKP